MPPDRNDLKRPGASHAAPSALAGAPASVGGAPGAATQGRQRIALRFRDAAALQTAYMGFVVGGGIFVQAVRGVALGDELELSLTLPESAEPVHVVGKVCWITPGGVAGRPEGVGVQFPAGEQGAALRERIEAIIAPRIDPSLRSHTI